MNKEELEPRIRIAILAFLAGWLFAIVLLLGFTITTYNRYADKQLDDALTCLLDDI